MAPDEPQHKFAKLKLDTHTPQKSIVSTFASISRDYRDDGFEDDESHDYNYEQEESAVVVTEPESYDGFSRDADISTLQESLRKRGSSISFAPEVTLDNGSRRSLEERLPKPKQSPQKYRGRTAIHDDAPHLPSERAYSEPEYRPGESRHPLLQATVDDLARDSGLQNHEHMASLTSNSTISPTTEELHTPVEPMTEYLLSPLPVSSPIHFASPRGSASWANLQRPGSVRSKGHRSDVSRTGSLRRQTRQNSGRSIRSNSSMSPASAFLSQWGKEEAAAMIEPDDEGQEIGDHSGYIIGRQIGYGGFSVVKEVYTIENNEKVRRAVKIVRKQVSAKSEHENDKLQAHFEHEVSIWRFLKHRHILPLIAVYDSPFATFCITNLNTGGTLFDLVRNTRKTDQRGLPAHLAQRYSYQLASALRYLHEDVRIVHRDIKLENCLLDMSDPDAAVEGGNVLLCDFGMSDFITHDHRDNSLESYESEERSHNANLGPSETSTNTIDGSLQYASPELISSRGPLYEPAADVWAFGVVVFALLVGDLPFQHSFQPKLHMMILRGEWDDDAVRDARGGSEDAVELVAGCLDMDPVRRWNVSEILACRWLEVCAGLFGEDGDNGWT
ncbi:kinase-like domain-containing protein [Cryomyces antarcticus]